MLYSYLRIFNILQTRMYIVVSDEMEFSRSPYVNMHTRTSIHIHVSRQF